MVLYGLVRYLIATDRGEAILALVGIVIVAGGLAVATGGPAGAASGTRPGYSGVTAQGQPVLVQLSGDRSQVSEIGVETKLVQDGHRVLVAARGSFRLERADNRHLRQRPDLLPRMP